MIASIFSIILGIIVNYVDYQQKHKNVTKISENPEEKNIEEKIEKVDKSHTKSKKKK